MNLPDSWVEARLDAVCQLNPRLASDERPQDETEVTFVPMSAVDEGGGVVAKPEVRTYGEVSKGYTSFKNRDVLFAKVTPCMENGKAAIAGSLLNGLGFGSTEFHVLRPTDVVLPEYLFHFIRQPVFRTHAASAFVGTGGLQRVPHDFLARVKLPLPTLPEQQRIVDVLRQAEAVTQLRQQSENLLIRTKRQLFVEMFGDPNPQGNSAWPIAKLGSAVLVATGGTPSREQPDSFGGAIAWVKSTDLTDKPILCTDENITDLGVQRSNAKVYPKDTVLLAMYGQGQTRGRTGKLLIEAACNQACAALLPSEELLPDYLWVWLQLSYEQVRSLGRGGQQENLNLDIVRGIELPKPPIPLQQAFSRRLKQLLDVTNTMKLAGQKTETLLAALRIEALTGEATAAWREKNRREIQDAAEIRDAALGRYVAKVSVQVIETVTTERATNIPRSARLWLTNELSEFQHEVWNTLRYEWRGSVIVDDPEVFVDFCTSPQTAWRIEHFQASPNRIRRTLEQLAALGLIAKISVPKLNPLTRQAEYLTAFRPLRKEENTKLADADLMRRALSLESSGGNE